MKVSNEKTFAAFKYLAMKTNNLSRVWTSIGIHNIEDIDLRQFGRLVFIIHIEDFSKVKKILFRFLSDIKFIPNMYKNQKYRVLCGYNDGDLNFKICLFNYNFQFFSMPIESMYDDRFMDRLKEKCDEIYANTSKKRADVDDFIAEYGIYKTPLLKLHRKEMNRFPEITINHRKTIRGTNLLSYANWFDELRDITFILFGEFNFFYEEETEEIKIVNFKNLTTIIFHISTVRRLQSKADTVEFLINN